MTYAAAPLAIEAFARRTLRPRPYFDRRNTDVILLRVGQGCHGRAIHDDHMPRNEMGRARSHIWLSMTLTDDGREARLMAGDWHFKKLLSRDKRLRRPRRRAAQRWLVSFATPEQHEMKPAGLFSFGLAGAHEDAPIFSSPSAPFRHIAYH